jgi:hypothetical protein
MDHDGGERLVVQFDNVGRAASKLICNSWRIRRADCKFGSAASSAFFEPVRRDRRHRDVADRFARRQRIGLAQIGEEIGGGFDQIRGGRQVQPRPQASEEPLLPPEPSQG